MLPVIALIGRPNVGKSTLFNRLTQTQNALVDDQPGVTRDRQYGYCRHAERPFLVVDTGGLAQSEEEYASDIQAYVEHLLTEVDVVLFVVNGQDGILTPDREISQMLRISGSDVTLVVNKTEGVDPYLAVSDFEELGHGKPVSISARRGNGIPKLLKLIQTEYFPEEGQYEEYNQLPGIAIVGRPNVGKSTILNQLAGEKRSIVSGIAGTTRDCVRSRINVDGNEFELIDTAGIRKKAQVQQRIEKFSVVKTLQAIEISQVVLLVIDANVGIQTQDITIAGMVNELGRSVVVVLNKWDGLSKHWKKSIVQEVNDRLSFLPDYDRLQISALYGTHVDQLIPAALRARKSAFIKISTSSLNRVLNDAVSITPPPSHRNRQIKLKYVHQAGSNPPQIVIHGNQVDKLPESYRRYLSRFLAKAYCLRGTSFRIKFQVSDNPYQARASKSRGANRRSK
ncbi:MAG: ribosome biogenesis GTPase Der [Gammaproteobacteria bacterium]|nr:ribosome biogenesis GTPase Der [Gammaproteobacteria bacterium]